MPAVNQQDMTSGKGYSMRSIYEWAPVTFVPASGKYLQTLHSFLNKLLLKLNIKCIYMINLQILSPAVCSILESIVVLN